MNKCPLCHGSLQKPKLLPCLDTVCFTCLDEHVVEHGRVTRTFPCPVCNLELPIPDGGLTQFDDNQHVKMEQSLEKMAAGEQLLCEVCEKRPRASQRCVDCEQNFCSTCSKAHLRLNIAKTHTLVNLTATTGKQYLTSVGYCEKHANEELTFYCRTCLAPICMRCRLTIHEDHTTEDLVDCAARTRRDLRLALDENNSFRFNMLNEIEELKSYMESILETQTEIEKAIGERRACFHEAVDNICDAMIDKLRNVVELEQTRVAEDENQMEENMLIFSNKIATASQMVDLDSDIGVVKARHDILGSMALAKKDVPLSMTGIRLDLGFSFQRQAEISLGYLLGKLSTEITPPRYINVTEISTFRVETTSDVINAICPALDDKCWVACGWKSEINLFDRFGQKVRSKKVGRDVDCLAIDSDGNSYVSCREERSVKRFDRNFRRRMATLNIEYPRGIATTEDNKLVICVNKTTTYFDYETNHENRVLKLGPDGDESKELKNPALCFMYPIRVAVCTNNELCVSDNLQHAVLFLRPNGELKASYSGRQQNDVTLVESTNRSRIMTAKTSTTRTGAVSFKLPSSRKEQDGPLDMMDRTQTPQNSPMTMETSARAIDFRPVPSSSGSSLELERSLGLLDVVRPQKSLPAYQRALSGLTGEADTASVTDVDSDIAYPSGVPLFDPRGITCDHHGHVIVCDYSSNRVHLLDKHGRFLMYLLTEADGIFGPTSVAVDNQGLLWVGGGNATVKVFNYIDPGYNFLG